MISQNYYNIKLFKLMFNNPINSYTVNARYTEVMVQDQNFGITKDFGISKFSP